MNFSSHALVLEHTLNILLMMTGGFFMSYVIASKICEEHRKTFYRILCAFIIVAFILGVRTYYVALFLIAVYYVICGLIYLRCKKKSERNDGNSPNKDETSNNV